MVFGAIPVLWRLSRRGAAGKTAGSLVSLHPRLAHRTDDLTGRAVALPCGETGIVAPFVRVGVSAGRCCRSGRGRCRSVGPRKGGGTCWTGGQPGGRPGDAGPAGLAVRRMALRGEALFVIEVTAMRVDLLPAWINDIVGAAAPATWVYDVQLEGPRGVTDVYRRPRWCTYGGRDHRRMGSAGFHRPGRCPRPARRRNRGCPGCALRVDARPAAGRGAT